MKARHSTALLGMALLMGILASLIASCKKSPETIGNNLISDSDYIGVYHTDTVAIVCHSYRDSVATGKATSALLGAMRDPVFGATEAGFYTQFRPSVAGQHFGSDPVLDSIVLQLHLAGYYGDTATLLTAHAYQLTDTIASATTYYNFSEVSAATVDLANGHQFRLHPNTKQHVLGADTVAQPIIRIPLSAELGNYLMTIDTNAYARPDLFKQAFYGLHLTCDPVAANGSIASINLTNNTFTLLQLYYHNATTPDKPMRYNYYVTSSDAYFNHFDHDYAQGSPEFVGQVIEGQTDLGQEALFLQTMGGVRAKVFFPNFNTWADTLVGQHLVINEAKLILPVKPQSIDSVYTAPKNFLLVGFNADSSTYLLPDYYEGAGFFGGTYDPSRHAVSFRITEYMQRILLGEKENNGLSLGINGASYNAQRIIINGPEAQQGEKMRLEVTYSLVNE